MDRIRIAFLGIALCAAAATVLVAAPVAGARQSSPKAEARTVATDFFRPEDPELHLSVLSLGS
jgi:hypothetical protein